MKYYNVSVYKATVCNKKPFVDIESLGKTVVAKSKMSGKTVIDPITEVGILIQKSRWTEQGLIKMNPEQIAQNGFCLFVYESQLTDQNLVTEEYFDKWLAGSDSSSFYQCCQEIMSSDSKPAYEKTIGKRRR